MKNLTITFLSLLALIAFLRCDDGVIDAPDTNYDSSSDVAAIELKSTHTVIKGFLGEFRSAIITATALNPAGTVIDGATVFISIVNPLSYKGTIAQSDTLTDDIGEVKAIYSVTISELNVPPNQEIEINAISGNIEKRISLDVSVIDDLIHRFE